MPVGAGSIKRASKKAQELDGAAVKKPVTRRKTTAKKQTVKEEAAEAAVLPVVTEPVKATNEVESLGKNERVEMLQELPVYLL